MLLFFMNRSKMVQQATLFRKTMVTKFMFFHSFCKRKNSSRNTIKDNLSRKEKKIPKITAQTYHLQIKMHKLNKHIFQYKKIFVNSKNRTLSLQVVSNGVPLGQLDHFEFNSPYHSKTFQTISINLIFNLHLLSYNFK